METRNVLDADNNIIGSLTLPDSTSEADWSRALNTYKEVPSIPDVTPRQIRQAIILSGISIASIEAAIDTLPEPTKSLVLTEWDYSIAFQRNRPLVNQVGAMLGMSSAQLDALWRFAATL
jgi:hypothetical protein